MALLNYDRDFSSGTILTNENPPGDWTGIEEGTSTQSSVVLNDGAGGRPPPHPGFARSALTSVQASDGLWNNHSYRCMIQDNQAGIRPTTGDEGYAAFAMYIPTGSLSNAPLLWELHHTAVLYNLSGGAVAPWALWPAVPNWAGRTGETITGNAFTSAGVDQTTMGILLRWTCGELNEGSGYQAQHFSIVIPGLQPIPYDTWITIILRLKFAEVAADGIMQLWVVVDNTPAPSDFVEGSPALSKTGTPTMPFDTERNIHNNPLYMETGVYVSPPAVPSTTNRCYHAGTRWRPTFADAVFAVTGDSTPPAPVEAPGAPFRFGKTQAGLTGGWLGDLQNYKRGTPYTVAADCGSVTSIYEYVRGNGTVADKKAMIYAMDGTGGTPGTLLGISGQKTIGASDAAAWIQYTFSGGVDLSTYQGQQVLLSTITNGADNAYQSWREVGSTGDQYLRLDNYTSGPSNPWSGSVGGGISGTYDNELALCAVYTAFSAPPPTVQRFTTIVRSTSLTRIVDPSLRIVGIGGGGI